MFNLQSRQQRTHPSSFHLHFKYLQQEGVGLGPGLLLPRPGMDGALQVKKTHTVLTRPKELLEYVHVPCCGAVGHRSKKGDWGEKIAGGDQSPGCKSGLVWDDHSPEDVAQLLL